MLRLILALSAATALQSAQAEDINIVDRIDHDRLASGSLHLGLFLNGEQDGFMRLGWTVEDGQVHAYDRSMLASQEIFETMEARLSAETLRPESIDIRFHSGANIFEFDVDFADGSVSNEITATRPDGQSGAQMLSAEFPDDGLARLTAFLIPAVIDMEIGERIAFTWFAPMSNSVAEVSLTAMDTAEVETPAGHYTTTRIELRGGSPENDIFVDQTSGEIVRIDVLGQDMSFLKLAEPG